MSSATESRVATAYARTREHLAYLGLADGVRAPGSGARAGVAPSRRRRSRSSSGCWRPRSRRPAPAGSRAACASPTTRSTSASPSSSSTSSPASTGRSSPSCPRCASSRSTATRCSWDRPGSARSHLAIALGIAATEAGYRTYFTTAADLVAAPHGGPSRGQLDRQDADLHRALGARDRRARLPADGRHVGPLDLPGRVPPLRAGLDRADVQPRLRRLGPGVRRPGRRDRHPRPPAAPRHGRQHQGLSLPDAGPRPISAGRALLCSADADRLCTFRGDLSARFVLAHRVDLRVELASYLHRGEGATPSRAAIRTESGSCPATSAPMSETGVAGEHRSLFAELDPEPAGRTHRTEVGLAIEQRDRQASRHRARPRSA